ncbi:MAG: hypothetical protein GY754_24595 [bacterium]|nr:hypothetical protein [bacterium]
MGISVYKYKVIKSSWGILILIKAEIVEKDIFDSTDYFDIKIFDGLYCSILAANLLDSGIDYILTGLKRVSSQIKASPFLKYNTCIVLHSIEFSLCDFQEEGLEAAIIEWAAKTFKFDKPKIEVNYNKKLNKYEFIYE